MKEIELSQGRFTLVDDEDYDWLNHWKWSAALNYKTGKYYAQRNEVNELGLIRPVLMHRVIMGAAKGQLIDHKNGNSLNNCRYNLRPCTNSQNMANHGPQVNNTSGYKGVAWNKINKRWIAQIAIMRKITYLGTFTDKADAARAYDKKAYELFGEFAYCNLPGDLNCE